MLNQSSDTHFSRNCSPIEKIDMFAKELSETLFDKDLVKKGFYLSLEALRREWKLGVNCPDHSKTEKGEFFCTRECFIKWLRSVYSETGVLHYFPSKTTIKPEELKWVQLEFDW